MSVIIGHTLYSKVKLLNQVLCLYMIFNLFFGHSQEKQSLFRAQAPLVIENTQKLIEYPIYTRSLSYTINIVARYPIYHLGGVKCVAKGINPVQIQPEKVWPTANFLPPAGLEPTTHDLRITGLKHLPTAPHSHNTEQLLKF